MRRCRQPAHTPHRRCAMAAFAHFSFFLRMAFLCRSFTPCSPPRRLPASDPTSSTHEDMAAEGCGGEAENRAGRDNEI